jgi:hypothetical protein
MRDRPLLVVAARLGEDVIDGFLDELKNSDAAFWSSSSDKSAEENVRETFFDLISRFAPTGGTPIPPPPASTAGLPPFESANAKTGRRTACMCGQHAARPQMSAFAEQRFTADPARRMSRRAARSSSTFFLPRQTEPKVLL